MARCSRQLHLLRDGVEAEPEGLRKEMLLARLETLVKEMAVEVSAFSIMDSHVHLVLLVDRTRVAAWSDEEVLRRWWALHPKRNGYNRPRAVTDEERAEALADRDLVEGCRRKLGSLSQFMKEFMQHAAEQINRLEEASGPVWAGRFKSVPVEDVEQLVATMIYVDLNPFAAGRCETPEEGRYTSLSGRLGRDEPPVETTPVAEGGVRVRGAFACAERSRSGAWLQPFDESLERQRARGQRPLADAEAVRAGSAGTVAAGLSLHTYLRLLDAVSRRIRVGKKRLPGDAASVFDRLGLNADRVMAEVQALARRYAVPPGLA